MCGSECVFPFVFLSDVEEEQCGGAERRPPCGEGRGRQAQPDDKADEAEQRGVVLCHGGQRGGPSVLQRHPLHPTR